MSVSDSATSQPDEVGRTVDAGGIATNYHDEGHGEPIVLLHGSGPGVSAWANWRLTLPALAGRYRVLAPDLVGFGYTDRPAGLSYDRRTWLRHLLDFLDVLELDRVSVVGNSFGGALALWLASEHPDRVHRLVLMGSVGLQFDITPGLDAVWGYEHSLDGMREIVQYFAYDRSRLTEDLVRMRYQAASRPGVAEAFAQMFPAPRQDRVDALAVDDEALRRLPHETLVVHGREDLVIPVEVSHRLSRLIDRCDLHVFGRCGHWVQIEAHERFSALVAEFLTAGV